MSELAVKILRLGLAAANGLLFAFGVWWAVEITILRVRRWRLQLSRLLRLQELSSEDGETDAQREHEITELRQRIKQHRTDPRTMFQLGFSILIICVALIALVGLIAPPWAALIR